MPRLWAGIDAGKTHHHCVVISGEGRRVLSRKVANDETDLRTLLVEVLEAAKGGEVLWAMDLNQGAAALLISLLVANAQSVIYVPGRTIHYASQAYRGDGKTDSKDAEILADQARMRTDLQTLPTRDEIAVGLRLLISRRMDLVGDRTRTLNRLRAAMLEYFPALEAAFDYARRKGALVLLTKYRTPAEIRHEGSANIASWLRDRGVRKSSAVAEIAVDAAMRQKTVVLGQDIGAGLVGAIAADALRLNEEVEEVDRSIETLFRQHKYAEILLSVPGFGPLLAAEFVAATGGTLACYQNADRLAGMAGVAPVPRHSGTTTTIYRRPKRYDRRLLRACYLSAEAAVRTCPVSKAYYDRKRREGKNHKQAVLALARRRINVIWALLRDGKPFEPRPVRAGNEGSATVLEAS